MEKVIKIGDKDVKLCNNIVWAIDYRSQFGEDIIQTFIPSLAAGIDLIAKCAKVGIVNGDFRVDSLLKNIDDINAAEAIIDFGSAIELNTLINITWALAKTADESIPEPRTWAKQFEVFPVDEVAPAVFDMITKGTVSSKNLKRLEDLKAKIKALQPKSTSTTSSSAPQSEG